MKIIYYSRRKKESSEFFFPTQKYFSFFWIFSRSANIFFCWNPMLILVRVEANLVTNSNFIPKWIKLDLCFVFQFWTNTYLWFHVFIMAVTNGFTLPQCWFGVISSTWRSFLLLWRYEISGLTRHRLKISADQSDHYWNCFKDSIRKQLVKPSSPNLNCSCWLVKKLNFRTTAPHWVMTKFYFDQFRLIILFWKNQPNTE